MTDISAIRTDSSWLPQIVSPITYVDGVPMLDGGIVDSIPVEYAMSQGYEKLVVVLTRKTPQNWLLYTRKVTILPLIRSKRQYIYRIFLYRHLLWL